MIVLYNFYSYSGEEVIESSGSYYVGWGSPGSESEEGRVPDGDSKEERLLRELYKLFSLLTGDEMDLYKQLVELDPGFYKVRGPSNYQYYQWYEFLGERNSESDFFEYENMEVDKNGLVSFGASGGYLQLDEEESEKLLEFLEECKQDAEEWRKDQIAQGNDVTDEDVEIYLKEEILFDQLQDYGEQGFGAGSTWYLEQTVDEEKLRKEAIKINADLSKLGREELSVQLGEE